jgi:NAD(P)-dependent dehydrogenase (short-subunit alcohol dehydrogenase family)
MDLASTSAIVTGGGSGLGEATVRLLTKHARHVVIVDIDDEKALRVANDTGAQYVHTDVTDPAQAVAAVEAATVKAPLFALVNCAGGGSSRRTIGRDGSVESAYPLESFAAILQLNTVGTFNMTRIAASAMSRNAADERGARGAIVNTASAAAFDGQIGQVAYSAAKAGIVGMTLPLSRDLAAVGIRVNTIAPGAFSTPPMMAAPEEMRNSLSSQVPFPNRLGDPAEFAELALHLLTNDYMNGETVRIDGAVRMPPK